MTESELILKCNIIQSAAVSSEGPFETFVPQMYLPLKVGRTLTGVSWKIEIHPKFMIIDLDVCNRVQRSKKPGG